MNELVSPKLEDLSSLFDKLETDTQEKGERLFYAQRADLLIETQMLVKTQ